MATDFIGELFAIGATLCFVLSNVIFRKVDEKVSPSQINAFRTIIGFFTYLVIALIVGQFVTIFSFPPILWLWLALSFIFGQVLGDTAYFNAQEMLGTTLALAISMTFPICTTLISFFLGVEIPVYFYGAMSMIIVGVIVIAIGKKRSMNITLRQDNTNPLAENDESEKNSKVQKILIELNISGEETKYGMDPGSLYNFIDKALNYRNIKIVGLMTIAPLTDDFELIRKIFRRLRILKDDLNKDFSGMDLTELSMGMSNDFKIAIEEGATMVRIGSMIFK